MKRILNHWVEEMGYLSFRPFVQRFLLAGIIAFGIYQNTPTVEDGFV
jgi:hypothetical protein